MNLISDRHLNSGQAITIADVLIPAWDRVCRIKIRQRPSFKSNDIASRKTAAFCRFQFWVVSITNTSLRRCRHDSPMPMTNSDRINADDSQGAERLGNELVRISQISDNASRMVN